METISAKVIKNEEQFYIEIDISSEEKVLIPMSEDKPNEVKVAFNRLILLLKDGLFEIVLTDVKGDLFSQVANEYINQLNRELGEVYGEMDEYNLLNKLDKQ